MDDNGADIQSMYLERGAFPYLALEEAIHVLTWDMPRWSHGDIEIPNNPYHERLSVLIKPP